MGDQWWSGEALWRALARNAVRSEVAPSTRAASSSAEDSSTAARFASTNFCSASDTSASEIERLIRDAIGPESYLLGCGAPILPSVGLVDAMRVSPDTGPDYEPPKGDLSQPSVRSAALSGLGRAWQHGRFWVNDPDCLLARPQVERRKDWAVHIERYGGLRGSSDRLRDLDEWGLQTTRRLLSTVPPPRPFMLDPA